MEHSETTEAPHIVSMEPQPTHSMRLHASPNAAPPVNWQIRSVPAWQPTPAHLSLALLAFQ